MRKGDKIVFECPVCRTPVLRVFERDTLLNANAYARRYPKRRICSDDCLAVWEERREGNRRAGVLLESSSIGAVRGGLPSLGRRP